MDSHSRSNKRLPKAIPATSSKPGKARKRLLRSSLTLIPDQTNVYQVKLRSAGIFMIAQAYYEASGSSLIEEILLAREFIID